MFDCHVHSNFSFDGKSEPGLYCEKAIEHGLEGIIFTDHLDYDFPGYDSALTMDFTAYMKALEELATQFYPKLEVHRGIEVGIQPHVIEKTLQVVQSYPFDYVLASIHILDGEDPYNDIYYQNKSKLQAYSRYLEEVLYMANHFEGFDAAGHLDYIIRNAKYDDRSLRYADHEDLLDSIFKVLIASGKGFEINTGSYRKGSDSCPVPAYDVRILKRYRELGGEIICLGSDAHNPGYLGFRFEYFIRLLREAGFRYITYFKNRRPVFQPI